MNAELYRTFQSQSGVPQFWAKKYAEEADKNWDKFYKRNSTNFYKDRHWTSSQSSDGFPCLSDPSAQRKVLVEAGCGVANCAFPLLETNPSLFVYAFDFASTAIDLIKSSQKYNTDRMHSFVWDFCRNPIANVQPEERGGLGNNVADFCALIFVLSSVPLELQVDGLRNLCKLLRPGGRLLFRDYAAGDMAEKRFADRSKIADHYFVRQDSTLAYFFSESRLLEIAAEAGFEIDYIRRVTRTITNRKEGKEMNRVFLQAELVNPISGM